jgi:hypothetical protein
MKIEMHAARCAPGEHLNRPGVQAVLPSSRERS